MEDVLQQITAGLKTFEYGIEFGVMNELDPALEKEMVAIQRRLHKKQKNMSGLIADIKRLIAKHPEVIPIQNCLATAYTQLNDWEKANELNNKILEKHPEYVIGVINKAGYYFRKDEYEMVPRVLGDLLEIGDRFPDRKTFHISEYLEFNKLIVLYYCATNKVDLAKDRLELMGKIAPDMQPTIDATKAIMQATMNVMLERMKREEELLAIYNEIPNDYLSLPQTDEPPVFTHPEIKEVYRNTLEIDAALMRTILSLPRKTVIKDLQEVICDSIRRFKFYNEEDWEAENEFLFHAIVLLAEVKATEALPALLDILRQGNNYLEYWFGDWLTEELWQIYYQLFDVAVYTKYLYEPRNYRFARIVILRVFEQKVLLGELPREQGEKFYQTLLQYHIDYYGNADLMCPGFLGCLIGDIIDLQLTGLLPLVKKCHEMGIVDEMICGDYEAVEEDIRTRSLDIAKVPEFAKGFEGFYQYMVEKWYKGRDEDGFDEEEFEAEDFDDDIPAEFEEIDEQKTAENFAHLLLAKKTLTGRNDPCPCGSGKKYKKCCMDKEE